MFVKLTDGVFIPAPSPLVVGENHVFTTDEAPYLAQGYKRRVFTSPPEQEGFVAVSAPPEQWQETETEYIQTWLLEQATPDADELLGMLEEVL
ncbi:MAG: hypothetical protein IJC18_03770 [Clostridia bacterium]|nr:hypothetical protein [Clostridia bacterium]